MHRLRTKGRAGITTDGGKVIQANSTIFIDNARTRVTEWRFSPGASTGWHRHEYDYVIVPLLDGKLRLSSGNDEAHVVELSAGVPYFRQEGIEHDVTNVNDYEYAFIEIEFK